MRLSCPVLAEHVQSPGFDPQHTINGDKCGDLHLKTQEGQKLKGILGYIVKLKAILDYAVNGSQAGICKTVSEKKKKGAEAAPPPPWDSHPATLAHSVQLRNQCLTNPGPAFAWGFSLSSSHTFCELINLW